MSTALVIDDIRENIALLEAYLELSEIEVKTSLTGEEAYVIAQNKLPDIIFIDLLMPGHTWDGYYTIEQLKTNPLTEDIPVVAVGGGNEKLAFQAGCDFLLRRPFNRNNLMMVLDKYLSGRSL